VIFIRKPRGQGVFFQNTKWWPSPATAMSANGKFSVIPCALDQRKLLRLGTGALRLRAFGILKTRHRIYLSEFLDSFIKFSFLVIVGGCQSSGLLGGSRSCSP